MTFFNVLYYLRLPKLRSCFTILAMAALMVTLSACGGGDGKDTDTNQAEEQTGEVVIGLTDAPGDFTTYTVDVVSLTLTKANGAVVETVPLSTRVDFAQYTDMTEFFTAATIPSGVYVSAKLTLDYHDADIRVEDDNGDAIAAGLIQDEDGMPIENTIALNVRLDGQNALRIAPGVPAHLTLDFDLNASNSVDLNGGSPIVTVSPYLVADVNAESLKVHRARGPLKSVDTADSSFRMIIRPFVHLLSGGDERFGTLKVTTNNNTVFDINGDVSQGGTGLLELSQQSALTAVVVIGELKFRPARFEATEVRAGSSVAGGSTDVVSGNVTGRSGDILTVKGATLIRANGSVVFNDQVQVTVGPGTTVRRVLSTDSLSSDDISVGQKISIFGSLTEDQAQNLALNASAEGNFALLHFTTLRATVVGTSPLSIDLQSVDGRRVDLFDFAGIGVDPANYEIDSGSINTGSISTGDSVKVRGFVKPFNNAESADFTAQSIVNVSAVPGHMLVGWPQTSSSAITIDADAGNVTLDFAGVGLFHHISRAAVVTDLTQLGMDTVIEPRATGIFFILQNGTWQLHTSLANYLSDLQSRLDNGSTVRGLSARGTFSDSTGTMAATSMTVQMM